MTFSEPQPLSILHDIKSFDCGVDILNHWLAKSALKNQLSGASRTFVVCDLSSPTKNQVVGFYALASGAVSHEFATGNIRRNMPNPIPVIVLGRLAVDKSLQGKNLGVSLLQDAVKRCYLVAEHIGARALLVHALDDNAKRFYLKYGFQTSPIHDLTLILKLGC